VDVAGDAEIGELVVFASELKAVLSSGIVPLELDAEAIDAYLTLGDPAAAEAS
jgi:hypothetical protein